MHKDPGLAIIGVVSPITLQKQIMGKRQLRPFAVEIRSSRQNSRNEVPVLTSISPRAFRGQERWPDERKGDKTPALWGGLSMGISKAVAQPTPVRIQPSEEYNGTRVSRVLPSLNSWMPTPDDTSERPTVRRPGRPRKRPTNVETLATLEPELRSEKVSGLREEPAFDQLSPTLHPVTAASPSPVMPGIGQQPASMAPRRSGRLLEEDWAYRIACRKAERLGKPRPEASRRGK